MATTWVLILAGMVAGAQAKEASVASLLKVPQATVGVAPASDGVLPPEVTEVSDGMGMLVAGSVLIGCGLLRRKRRST